MPRQRAVTLVRRHARRGPVLEAKDVAFLERPMSQKKNLRLTKKLTLSIFPKKTDNVTFSRKKRQCQFFWGP